MPSIRPLFEFAMVGRQPNYVVDAKHESALASINILALTAASDGDAFSF